MRKHFVASLLTVVACSTLVGCAGNAPVDGATASASTSASASASALARAERTPNPTSEVTGPPLEQADIPCEDGTAHVEGQNNKEVSVPDCTSVVIDSSNAVVHLGKTELLTVNGAINGIDAASLAKLVINGDGNRITTPSKPTVRDKGTSNIVNH
ncbi:DUF3060 domain-containing protein [Curtobacterium sp. MCPF17_046]|uniref:DUF3060 domain-containing protein n=1 Tax=Curtobacterium sp. MCPF17_046 TaxID=2175663 RepID=UPI000D923CCE|nr:DUF3060 domain-containing protein [Curtobacterium sp. MCPF17_046]PYY39099.1 hypothetical protein DEJ32_09155 [Curtobacterium sp. MCPF17_046]